MTIVQIRCFLNEFFSMSSPAALRSTSIKRLSLFVWGVAVVFALHRANCREPVFYVKQVKFLLPYQCYLNHDESSHIMFTHHSCENKVMCVYRVAQKNGATGHPISLQIFRKLHDRIAWKFGGLLQYYMLNTVINFLFKNFIVLWRHLVKTPLLSFIHTVQIDLSIR